MAQARPISMTVLALLNFVFGGLGIFSSLIGFVTANAAMSNPLTSFQRHGSEIAMLILYSAIVNLGTGILGIIAGIGLVKVARWGWGVTLAYAIVALISNGVGLFQAGDMSNFQGSSANDQSGYAALILAILGCLYPVILIIFLNTAKWKNAFAANQLNRFSR